MPTYNRHRAGVIAQKVGQQFESILESKCHQYKICCIRIPDGCRQVRGARGYQLLRVATPFDYVLFHNKKTIVLDAKTVDGETFSFSAIKDHQLKSLLKCSAEVHAAGYLVWHRSIDQVVFYSVAELGGVKKRGSLNPSLGLAIGTIHRADFSKLFYSQRITLDSQHKNAE